MGGGLLKRAKGLFEIVLYMFQNARPHRLGGQCY